MDAISPGMNLASAAGSSVVGWTETSGASSKTRWPVNSESAAPVRANAMLINSEIESRWRSVSCITLLSPNRGLDHAEHVLGHERLVDEGARARLFDQSARRSLYVGAGDDDARARVQLAQLGQNVEPVHALLRLDDAVPGRLKYAPQRPARHRGVVNHHYFFTHTASRIARAIS